MNNGFTINNVIVLLIVNFIVYWGVTQGCELSTLKINKKTKKCLFSRYSLTGLKAKVNFNIDNIDYFHLEEHKSNRSRLYRIAFRDEKYLLFTFPNSYISKTNVEEITPFLKEIFNFEDTTDFGNKEFQELKTKRNLC